MKNKLYSILKTDSYKTYYVLAESFDEAVTKMNIHLDLASRNGRAVDSDGDLVKVKDEGDFTKLRLELLTDDLIQ